jgi:hypothetical protein
VAANTVVRLVVVVVVVVFVLVVTVWELQEDHAVPTIGPVIIDQLRTR